MTAFTVHTRSTATVGADREAVWSALTDPDLLPRLTPYLRSIEVDGDRWTWHLMQLPVLGQVVSPSFTELMGFDEPRSITFTHDPRHDDERAGVEGRYLLSESPAGVDLDIDLAITVELPFPRLAKPAVQVAMHGVVATMGRRFSGNLVRHLREQP